MITISYESLIAAIAFGAFVGGGIATFACMVVCNHPLQKPPPLK